MWGAMRVSGTYEVTIDEKGRVMLPAKFRDLFSEQALLVRLADRDSCVRVYTPEAWEQFETRYLDPLDEFGSQADNWTLKDIYSNLHSVTLDKQRRVLVPREMVRELELSGRLKLVGIKNHLEIWNPETYERERVERGAERAS